VTPAVRVIGTDGEEIQDLDGWLEHAPPEKGMDQWVDGFSAKEQAKSWLRHGDPALPAELLYAVAVAGFGQVDRWTAYPERYTEFDDYSRGSAGARHHDMLVLLGHPDKPMAVLGIEAKACEDFDGIVAKKVTTPPPSNAPVRCNLLSQALFGRPVCDDDERVVIDEQLGQHGYQLWTASIGTVIEAQEREVAHALALIHQFAPGADPCPADDDRAWATKLPANAAKVAAFRSGLGPMPASTFETEYVKAGTRLHLLTAVSLMHAASV
jgi:hypothetical protein